MLMMQKSPKFSASVLALGEKLEDVFVKCV